MSPSAILAIDLGASGGRAVLGRIAAGQVSADVLHRFGNEPLRRPDGLFWNVPQLLHEIKHALRVCAQRGITLDSVGIDSWGVDYGLLDARDELIALPYHYRDARTDGVMERVVARVSRERIYTRTGIQFMPLNTLYQLAAETQAPAGRLAQAERLLFMSDLFNQLLCGSTTSERSIASTSQLRDFAPPARDEWAGELAAALAIPERILPTVRPSGALLGPLRDELAAELGLQTTVIAPCGHDTACAVAAVPATGDDWAYISSGTWSPVGLELRESVRSPAALAANITNEAGVDGTVRFLRNVTGLWLVQECKRTWELQRGANGDAAAPDTALSYEALMRLARTAPAHVARLDPDDPCFAAPGDMPERIRQYCRDTGQTPPHDPASIVRCILESLALKYRSVLENIAAIAQRQISVIHIVGGGANNELLCQFTADATGKRILAGPAEATALGNILIQALAAGRLASLAELRRVVAASVRPKQYEPREHAIWQRAWEQFRELPARAARTG